MYQKAIYVPVAMLEMYRNRKTLILQGFTGFFECILGNNKWYNSTQVGKNVPILNNFIQKVFAEWSYDQFLKFRQLWFYYYWSH